MQCMTFVHIRIIQCDGFMDDFFETYSITNIVRNKTGYDDGKQRIIDGSGRRYERPVSQNL